MTPQKAIREVREIHTGTEFSIRTETWNTEDNSEEIRHAVVIETGDWRSKRIIASADTLEGAMDQLRYHYEGMTCAECRRGAVDSQGLCVLDADHRAIA